MQAISTITSASIMMTVCTTASSFNKYIITICYQSLLHCLVWGNVFDTVAGGGRSNSTMSVLESIVAGVLNKYLGKYVENLDSNNLDLGILSGEWTIGYQSGVPEWQRPAGQMCIAYLALKMHWMHSEYNSKIRFMWPSKEFWIYLRPSVAREPK